MTETGAVILYDQRGHSGVRERLTKAGLTLTPCMLDEGDLMITTALHEIAIEIKTVDDLLGSIRGGRLFAQCARMIAGYEMPILVSYGMCMRGDGDLVRTFTGMKASPPWARYEQVMAALVSLGAQGMVVPPIQFNEQDAADLIVTIIRWASKSGHRSLASHRKPFAFGSADQLSAIGMLTGIQHIDVTLAERLLEKFGSVLAISQASEEELTNVRGVGKMIAKRVFFAFRGR